MTFTSDLSRFCEREAPDYLEKTVRRVVIEIGNRCVLRSPVGDATYWKSAPPPGYTGGRFRANWQHGLNFIPTVFTDAVDKSGNSTLAAIASAVALGNAVGVHYITNNLPYAERIENGWSRQAPQGIVGRVELEFPAIVRKARA